MRPASSRSERGNARPGTPGVGSIGVNTQVTVESRPLTHQGMMSMRNPSQGPGRKILDKSYFLGKLRSKKQELQAEIDIMTAEIDRLKKRGPASVHLEHQQELLLEELKSLRGQLGDYNMVMENVAAGIETEQLKDALKSLKGKNEKERMKIDQLFSEQSQKEMETKIFEVEICQIEFELEHQLNQALDQRAKFVDIQLETQLLRDEVEQLENKMQDLNATLRPLEQDLAKAPLAKQKAFALMEQLLSAEDELAHLKAEDTCSVRASQSESREAMLFKIRQENAEIARAEDKCRELETQISIYQDKLVAAEKAISELKGGRAERFQEIHEKEKQMQFFIDNYEVMRHDHSKAIQLVQEKIGLLLENISAVDCTVFGKGAGKDTSPEDNSDDIEQLTQELDELRREHQQLEEMEAKTEKEIGASRQKMVSLKAQMEKFTRFEELRAAAEARCSKLEEEKSKIQAKASLVQEQLREQDNILETMQKQLNACPHHKSLELQHQKLRAVHQSILTTQQELEAKEREVNYKPVLENIRFVVAQLNAEIMSKVAQ